MKIAIISDIHDNIPNLEKCLNWVKNEGIERLICCGDVVGMDTINFLATNFSGEIFLVYGNMELYDDNDLIRYLSIKYLGRYGAAEIDGHTVGLCHEPEYIPKVLAQNPGAKIIFYGHTHKPWIETKDGITLVNPGTLGGVFQKASFAFWETDSGSLELKILDMI